MASTTFVNNETIVVADWLNDVNNYVYNGAIPPGSPYRLTPADVLAGNGITVTPGLTTTTIAVSDNLTITSIAADTVNLRPVTTGFNFTVQQSGVGGGTLGLAVASNGTANMSFPAANDTVTTLSTAQTFSGVKSFTSGTFKLLGSTSGTTTLNASAVAGTGTMTLPTGTDTLAGLAGNNTWTGAQRFNTNILDGTGSAGTATYVLTSQGAGSAPVWAVGGGGGGGDMYLANVQTVTGAKTFGTVGGAVGKFILAGSTSGTTIVNAAAVAGSGTMTLPTGTGTLAALGTAQTWTGLQTFALNDFCLKGSSTGCTLLNSSLAGAGNNTLTLPTNSDTLAGLNGTNIWTGPQSFNSGNVILKGSTSGTTNVNAAAIAGTTTATFPAVTGTIRVTGDGNAGAVADGGTGVTTMTTAYAPVCAGTTATGALQTASTGLSTAGFVLTSNGASTLPSFQASSSGGWVKISTATASASTSLDFPSVFSATYRSYMIVISGLISTASANLWLRVTTNNGSTYSSGASDYSWANNYVTQAAAPTVSQAGASTDTKIVFSNATPTGGSRGFTGYIQISNPNSATSNFLFQGGQASTSFNLAVSGAGAAILATLTGFQILQSTSTIASGSVTVFGVIN